MTLISKYVYNRINQFIRLNKLYKKEVGNMLTVRYQLGFSIVIKTNSLIYINNSPISTWTITDN
ncbi:hypothetical protein CPJCM30710_17310 [Clostridium polyendosporum]|uniref:Uncharacterized protein n=1 Tax=Clostridium polyendosporum TaxID=69208 RepID=A0A919S0T0_9CLOT|nr:hypothetical protein CPJCM30710_17310 [Clostridium polyendosporum]